MKQFTFLLAIYLLSTAIDSFAQTNCGNGTFIVSATRIQYIGGDGANNSDDSGFGAGFEHRFNPTSNAGSGAAGPGCQYYSDDNDFNPNLLVAQHVFNVGGGCATLPNTITVAGNIHETTRSSAIAPSMVVMTTTAIFRPLSAP